MTAKEELIATKTKLEFSERNVLSLESVLKTKSTLEIQLAEAKNKVLELQSLNEKGDDSFRYLIFFRISIHINYHNALCTY